MLRLMLTDKLWEKLLQIMKNTGRIYNKSEHRMIFEGILYRLRTGIPWRDGPPEFGDWSAVYRRFNSWSKKGMLTILFNELAKPSDYDWGFADGSIIRAHQHNSGAATSEN
jgi:transposase